VQGAGQTVVTLARDEDLFALDLDVDLGAMRPGELAELALDRDFALRDVDLHAVGDGNRFFANSGHDRCSFQPRLCPGSISLVLQPPGGARG
jgi:hypothetical protein